MFVNTVVPSVFAMGIIILKRSILDPNMPNNYRPITLGSTHRKIIEILIFPQDQAHENQYGFRNGRSASMACSLLNDLIH